MIIRELTIDDIEIMKELFKSVISGPPWYEDWSDGKQLDEYFRDLIEVRNPVNFGLYEDDKLIGLSVGRMKHWCGGNEYWIEEFCIHTDYQGKGCGTEFISMIENRLAVQGYHQIFLFTDRNKPAYRFYHKLGFEELPHLAAFFREF